MSSWKNFRKHYLPYFIAYPAKWLMRLIYWSCSKSITGLDQFLLTASKNPCILMLWHNRLTMTAEILYKNAPHFIYAAFISNSRDGEPLAILAESYTFGRVLRVPHNLRHGALNTMIKHLKEKQEVVLITPDGPRGPRYEIKPGIVMAAQESGAYIVPFSWEASKCWRLKTWDGMIIPKPFSKITITLGAPIKIDKEMPQEEAIAILKASLHIITLR